MNNTSCNAAQYQTNPGAELAALVGTKFDEVVEPRSMRTLDQFRSITIKIDSEVSVRSYQVPFVTFDDRMYVYAARRESPTAGPWSQDLTRCRRSQDDAGHQL